MLIIRIYTQHKLLLVDLKAKALRTPRPIDPRTDRPSYRVAPLKLKISVGRKLKALRTDGQTG